METHARVATPMNVQHRRASVWVMFCLIFAGEAIFSLPFHIARFFRPTLLDAFTLSNATLGDIYAVYGITAMLAYFPGGALADYFAARNLLTASLLATAAGGLVLATFPEPWLLATLYGYWGLTTILLFWAALIRATREWGGDTVQGRAFGILDGGRGLVAAALATLAVQLLGAKIGVDHFADNATGLITVIYFYTAVTAFAGMLCWWVIPTGGRAMTIGHRPSVRDCLTLIAAPRVWCQAAIVVAAYCGYKGLDYYTLYAKELLHLDDLGAATLMAQAAYLRPVAAIAAGLLADRLGAGRVIIGLFIGAAIAYFALALSGTHIAAILYANFFITIAGVYGLRGIYFALLEESKIPHVQTGTAVGVISVVGYTPDVFFAPIAGRLLDTTPGAAGFNHVFVLSAVIFMVGAMSALVLRLLLKRLP